MEDEYYAYPEHEDLPLLDSREDAMSSSSDSDGSQDISRMNLSGKLFKRKWIQPFDTDRLDPGLRNLFSTIINTIIVKKGQPTIYPPSFLEELQRKDESIIYSIENLNYEHCLAIVGNSLVSTLNIANNLISVPKGIHCDVCIISNNNPVLLLTFVEDENNITKKVRYNELLTRELTDILWTFMDETIRVASGVVVKGSDLKAKINTIQDDVKSSFFASMDKTLSFEDGTLQSAITAVLIGISRAPSYQFIENRPEVIWTLSAEEFEKVLEHVDGREGYSYTSTLEDPGLILEIASRRSRRRRVRLDLTEQQYSRINISELRRWYPNLEVTGHAESKGVIVNGKVVRVREESTVGTKASNSPHLSKPAIKGRRWQEETDQVDEIGIALRPNADEIPHEIPGENEQEETDQVDEIGIALRPNADEIPHEIPGENEQEETDQVDEIGIALRPNADEIPHEIPGENEQEETDQVDEIGIALRPNAGTKASNSPHLSKPAIKGRRWQEETDQVDEIGIALRPNAVSINLNDLVHDIPDEIPHEIPGENEGLWIPLFYIWLMYGITVLGFLLIYPPSMDAGYHHLMKCLPLLFLIIFVGYEYLHGSTYKKGILLFGLVCSCVGDALFVWKPDYFEVGLTFFSLAHISYKFGFELKPKEFGKFLIDLMFALSGFFYLTWKWQGIFWFVLLMYLIAFCITIWRYATTLHCVCCFELVFDICFLATNAFILVNLSEIHSPFPNQITIMLYYTTQLGMVTSILKNCRDEIKDYKCYRRGFAVKVMHYIIIMFIFIIGNLTLRYFKGDRINKLLKEPYERGLRGQKPVPSLREPHVYCRSNQIMSTYQVIGSSLREPHEHSISDQGMRSQLRLRRINRLRDKRDAYVR